MRMCYRMIVILASEIRKTIFTGLLMKTILTGTCETITIDYLHCYLTGTCYYLHFFTQFSISSLIYIVYYFLSCGKKSAIVSLFALDHNNFL